MTENTKIKCLCFHGFNQNAEIFHHRLASVRSQYKNRVEFIIHDAPNRLPLPKTKTELPQTCAWYYYSKDDPLNIDWGAVFNKIENKDELFGLETSINYVKEILANNKIDYFLGFSQGSAFLSLLCKLNIINKDNAKKLIFVSGFYPLKMDEINTDKINIPSMHIIGENDEVIVPSSSRTLATMFSDPIITVHKGKHVVPKIKNFLSST